MRLYDVTVWGDNFCAVYTVEAPCSLDAFAETEKALFADGVSNYNKMVAERRE